MALIHRKIRLGIAAMLACCIATPWSWAQNSGITDKAIVLGSLLPLEGDRKENGLAIKAGLEAALASQTVQGRRVKLLAQNDFYTPSKTVEIAKQMISQGIFLMLGNYGTPTATAILPLLAENKISLLGPYTGAGLTGPGEVLTVRASYANEVESVISVALAAGIKPTEVCAYVQNDAYGMSGVQGLRASLASRPNTAAIVAKLDAVISQTGENPKRNQIGPVGVYERDTLAGREGYLSLKKWEKDTDTHCRLVVTVGVYDAVYKFIAYARSKGETWAFSLLSTTGAPTQAKFEDLGVTGKVLQTQVMPPLDSTLPLVEEARKALGQNLNYVSLEGYLVGKLFLAMASAVEGPLTREGFLKAARRQAYDIGGLKLDFTQGKNPGSNLIFISYLKDKTTFVSAKPGELEALLAQ